MGMWSHSQALNSNDVFDGDYHHKKRDWALLLWRQLGTEKEKGHFPDPFPARTEIGIWAQRLRCTETYSKIFSPSCWDGHQEMFPVPRGRNDTELTFTLGNWNGKNVNNKYKSSYTDHVLFCYPVVSQMPQGKQGNGTADHLCGIEVYSLFTWIDPLCLPIALWIRNYWHLIDKKREAQEGSWVQYFIKSQAYGWWGVDGT